MSLKQESRGQSSNKTRELVRERGAEITVPMSLDGDGTLGGDRTPSLLVRSQTLYPLSYEGETRSISDPSIAAVPGRVIDAGLVAGYGWIDTEETVMQSSTNLPRVSLVAWRFWLGPLLLLAAGLLVAIAIIAGPPVSQGINGVAGAVWVASAVYLLLELRHVRNALPIFAVALAGALVMGIVVRPATYLEAVTGFFLIGAAVAIVAEHSELKWAMLAPALYFPVHIAFSIGKVLLSDAPRQVRTDPPPTEALVPLSMVLAAALAGFVVSAIRQHRGGTATVSGN